MHFKYIYGLFVITYLPLCWSIMVVSDIMLFISLLNDVKRKQEVVPVQVLLYDADVISCGNIINVLEFSILFVVYLLNFIFNLGKI